MFTALSQEELDIVIDAIEEVSGNAGDVIIKEGDEQGDFMCVLEKGNLDCTKVFAGKNEPTHLKTYEPGEGFGELALLYNCPRAASITAKTPYTVWKLDRDTFNHIVKDAAAKKREKYDNFLQTVKILSSLDPYERSRLGDAVQEHTYKKKDLIITQGDEGGTFYLIESGTCNATKSVDGAPPTVVKEYTPGDYFGERALLMDERRAANIVVTSDKACCLSLDRETFTRLLGPLEEILRRNMDDAYNWKA